MWLLNLDFDDYSLTHYSLLTHDDYYSLLLTTKEGFSAGLESDNLYQWQIMVIGPQGTPYEGNLYLCQLYL